MFIIQNQLWTVEVCFRFSEYHSFCVCVYKRQAWGWECNSTSLSLFSKILEITISTSMDFVKVTFHNVFTSAFCYSINIY